MEDTYTESVFSTELRRYLNYISEKVWEKKYDEEHYDACIDQFLNQLSRLYFDYFEAHVQEARVLALDYQTALSYCIDYINVVYTNNKEYLVTDEFDEAIWNKLAEVNCNFQVFNALFGFIGTLSCSKKIDDYVGTHAISFEGNNKKNHIDLNTIIPLNVEYHKKLHDLLKAIKLWDTKVDFRMIEAFMGDLLQLYFEYFQYHLGQVSKVATPYQAYLSKVVSDFDKYIDTVYSRCQTSFTSVDEVYYQDPQQRLCFLRSEIEAFNQMFSFLELKLDHSELTKNMLLWNKKDKSLKQKEHANMPQNHWWWL